MNSGILWLELVVGITVSVTLLAIFIRAVNQGQFDDSKKHMDGLLFDSTDDLQDAVNKEAKVKEIKENKEGLSVREQAKKYNVSVSTIMKWRKRDTPYERHGTKDLYKNHISITPLEEHIICEIRKTTLLGIEELVEIVNQIGIKVTRSGLYRALKRNGLSNIRELLKSFDKETKEEIKEFKKYEPGYLHIDVKVLPKINKERKYLFVSIDRVTRLYGTD